MADIKLEISRVLLNDFSTLQKSDTNLKLLRSWQERTQLVKKVRKRCSADGGRSYRALASFDDNIKHHKLGLHNQFTMPAPCA